MGRTLPTITMTLASEEEAWKLFRRALRKEDQEAFDALWRAARRHAAPAAMAGRAVPMDAVLMAMLTALERQVLDLERYLRERHDAKTGGVDL
ncbi:MAG: hypothetical protein PHU21_11540 [Elusimicrobia bacterium]|nr:hypothetical protein [Elusimicrobiota bacterium]